jgi:cellulose biosynthesis protein BcsQ
VDARARGAALPAMTPADSHEPGSVVTFYSYKGGTGRSMALANVACLLALRQTAAGGKRVLAIDWDLEAPGLHRYFQPYLRHDEPRPGLIDLFEDARRRLDAMSATGDEETRARTLVEGIDLDRYVIPTSYPSLSLIRAGRFEETYSERVNTFPWQSFFRAVPSFYRFFAERLAGEYPWVLLDSRTGLTDISGVCTMLMPEKLVVVFTPNQQSLTGIVPLIRRATEYRRGSDDLRPLVVYPLPSRIETSMQPLAQRWRLGDPSQGIDGWQQQFNAVFREVYDLEDDFTLERYFDEVQLQHVAPYSYGEPLPVTEERGTDRLTLTNSYETFRGYLEADAPWAERTAPSAADAQEVRTQADRLHEVARAQRTLRTLPVRGAEWMAANRVVSTAVFLAMLFGAAVIFVLANRAEAEQRGLRLLSATLRDAGRNPNAVTALLLEQAQGDLSGDDRAGALRELTKVLEEMPEQSKRIPIAGGVNWLELSPDGKSLLVVAGDGNLTVREIATGAVRDFPLSYSTARFADDGAIVGEANGRIVRVDRQDRTRGFPIEGKLLAMSPRGRYVSTLQGERVVVSEIDGIKPVLSVPIDDPYREIDTTYYKEAMAGVVHRRAFFLGDLRTGSGTTIPFEPMAGPYAFTDGFVAMAESGGVQIWRLRNATAEPLRFVRGDARTLVFSQTADRLAMARDDGNLAIVEVAQGESGSRSLSSDPLLSLIQRPRGNVPRELVWVGEHLVALGDDWLEAFDTSRSGTRPLRFQAPAGTITQVRQVSDLVAVGTRTGVERDANGEVILLKLTPLPDLINLTTPERRKVICARTGRNLTSEEWLAYGKERPYARICKTAP